jgi:hypothetical protein
MKGAIVALILSLPTASAASPYFRLIDPAHPQVAAGALFDPAGLNKTYAVTSLALITHSTKDGSIVPEKWQTYLPPEAWTPLQVGGGGTGGEYVASVGASANFLPITQTWALKGINAISKPDALTGLKDALTPSSGSFSLAAGPAFAFIPIVGGMMLPVSEWKGLFRWYGGAAWKF